MAGDHNALYSSDWFAQVLDCLDDMVLVKGPGSRLVWANRAFRVYYGMSNQELWQLIDGPQSDPDDTVQYVKDDHWVFNTGERLDIPRESVTHANGAVRVFHTVKTALRGPTGEIEGTVGVSRLVEDERAVQMHQLARSQRKASLAELREFVSTVPVPLAMCDAQLHVIECSEAWNAWFEAPAASNLDYEVYQAVLPVRDELAAVVRTGQKLSLSNVTSPHPTHGDPRIVDVDAHPWFLSDRSIGGVIVVIRDMTAERRASELLQQANDELVQFNYRASHDLRGPLRTVLGLLEMLGEDLAAGDTESAQEIIGRASSRLCQLSGLVEDLLELARADVADSSRETIHLDPLIETVLAQHAEELASSNIEVRRELGCGSVPGQRIRLQQCLANLVSNAIKYHKAEDRGREIVIACGENEAGCWVEVRDNGVGFSHPEIAFEMFRRGSGSVGGAGLGLYLVAKHMSRMGGRATVRSPVEPTIVRLDLPKGPTA